MWKHVLRLYFSPYSPPARGAYMVAKALNLEVDLRHVNIMTKEYLTPELVSINPQHTIPTLADGNFVIWDSHAISGYLVGMYGKDDNLYPRNPQKRAIIDQRLHFDTEQLFPKVLDAVYPLLFRGKTMIPDASVEGIKRSYGLLEKFLNGSEWLAGKNVTVADLCSVPSISTLDNLVPISQNMYPRLFQYMERCKKLPYYQEANQVGVDMLGNKIQERLVQTYVKIPDRTPIYCSNVRRRKYAYVERRKKLPYYQEANQVGVGMLGTKIHDQLVQTYVKGISLQ